MTEERAHSAPRLRQWLAYLGITVAGGSSLATSDCSETFSRTLQSEVTWKPGAAWPTKTFEHNGWGVTLAVTSPVRVLVEASSALPEEPGVPWPAEEPRLDGGGSSGAAGAPVVSHETSWPGGAIVEPNFVTYVEIDCDSAPGYYGAECSPFHVRVTPWETTPSTEFSVSLEVTASVDSGCSEEYAVFVREAE